MRFFLLCLFPLRAHTLAENEVTILRILFFYHQSNDSDWWNLNKKVNFQKCPWRSEVKQKYMASNRKITVIFAPKSKGNSDKHIVKTITTTEVSSASSFSKINQSKLDGEIPLRPHKWIEFKFPWQKLIFQQNYFPSK